MGMGREQPVGEGSSRRRQLVWSDRHCHASSIWLEHQFGALVCGSVQQASRIRLSRANVRRGSECALGRLSGRVRPGAEVGRMNVTA